MIRTDTFGAEEPITATSGVPMRVGGTSSPASGYLDGAIFFLQWYDAEGGTLKGNLQASDFMIGDGDGAIAQDSTGKFWTLNGAQIAVL